MCGIVGYIGDREAADFLMDGLAKLEYRGYDSAGIAVYNDGAITVRKKAGRLVNLAEEVKAHPVVGTLGIGRKLHGIEGRTPQKRVSLQVGNGYGSRRAPLRRHV